MNKTENRAASEQQKLAGGRLPPVAAQGARVGDRARRLALLLASTAGIALLHASPSAAITINDQTAAQSGGVLNYWDSSNVYSNVGEVNSVAGSCTGTLINSRTILTAAHCFISNNGRYDGGATNVNLNANVNGTNSIAASSSIINQGFLPNANNSYANDVALISLAVPITNITPAKLLTANPGSTGFPPTGAVVALVGYGNTGTGSNPNVDADGRRRVAYTQLGGYYPERTLTTNGLQPNIPNDCTTNANNCITKQGTQPFFAGQFQNPQNPAQFNYFNLTANPPTLQGGTRAGDSGGPLYWCPTGAPNQCSLSQLVLIGELFGGSPPAGAEPQGYGDISVWTPVNLFTAWLAQNNPLRLVTANAGNFNWSNAGAWNDSVLGQTGFAPNNTVVYNQAAGIQCRRRTDRGVPAQQSVPVVDAQPVRPGSRWVRGSRQCTGGWAGQPLRSGTRAHT